jgi:hypothetical protein
MKEEPNETTEMWREFHKEADKRKLNYYELAKKILIKTNYKYEIKEGNRTILFREDDNLKVDYFPSTGKWKFNNRMFKGNIANFISWYSQKRKRAL